MRILVHDYAGHPFQVHLSRQLARRGHDVTHAYFADDPGPKGMLRTRPDDPPSLSFIGISTGRPYDKGSLMARRVNDIAYGKHVATLIHELRPDLVISGNTPTEAQTAVIRASKAVRARAIHWLQDFYSIAASKLLRKRLGIAGSVVGAYYRFLERRQLRASDAVIVITEDFRPLAAAWAGSDKKVHTIENWAALDDLPLRPKDNNWSRAHALHQDFTFLYTGTLGLKHNPELLRRLAEESASRVVVVGQGVGMKRLESAKSAAGLDTLHLLPLQPAEHFPEVLATGDVLVAVVEADAGTFSVPSKVQGYLCAGRPILLAAPRDNLAARVVAREEAGIVVGPEDEAAFIAAAVRLRDDPALRARLSANARAYAERTFDIERITDAFEDVMRVATGVLRPGLGVQTSQKQQRLNEAETFS